MYSSEEIESLITKPLEKWANNLGNQSGAKVKLSLKDEAFKKWIKKFGEQLIEESSSEEEDNALDEDLDGLSDFNDEIKKEGQETTDDIDNFGTNKPDEENEELTEDEPTKEEEKIPKESTSEGGTGKPAEGQPEDGGSEPSEKEEQSEEPENPDQTEQQQPEGESSKQEESTSEGGTGKPDEGQPEDGGSEPSEKEEQSEEPEIKQRSGLVQGINELINSKRIKYLENEKEQKQDDLKKDIDQNESAINSLRAKKIPSELRKKIEQAKWIAETTKLIFLIVVGVITIMVGLLITVGSIFFLSGIGIPIMTSGGKFIANAFTNYTIKVAKIWSNIKTIDNDMKKINEQIKNNQNEIKRKQLESNKKIKPLENEIDKLRNQSLFESNNQNNNLKI